MATIKKGILTSAREWWVHLRPYGKRDFWHRERRAAVRDADSRVDEVGTTIDIGDDFDRKMWKRDHTLPPA